MATVLVEALVRWRCISMLISQRKLPKRVQKVKVGSLSKPIEAGFFKIKFLKTKVPLYIHKHAPYTTKNTVHTPNTP